MKSLAVFLIVMILASATVATTLAAGPVIFPFEDSFSSQEIYCGGDIGVGDFWIWDNVVISGFEKYWYDEHDNAIKMKGHVNGIDSFYADFDPKMTNVVRGQFAGNITVTIDPETGDWIKVHGRGSQWNIHLPGKGVVLHIAGSDWFENGEPVRTADLKAVDFATLCTYFAQFAP